MKRVVSVHVSTEKVGPFISGIVLKPSIPLFILTRWDSTRFLQNVNTLINAFYRGNQVFFFFFFEKDFSGIFWIFHGLPDSSRIRVP